MTTIAITATTIMTVFDLVAVGLLKRTYFEQF
jgi:hypothetical protein